MEIRTETNGVVTTLIVERNDSVPAFNGDDVSSLANQLRRFERNPDSLAAVLYGPGGFCSSRDLHAITSQSERTRRISRVDSGMIGGGRFVHKPIIAAISGNCAAGGIEFALWCDYRVMEENAQIGAIGRRFGIPLLDPGTMGLLPLIGLGRALDLLLTGRPIGAAEALEIGLVDRVVHPGTSRQAAELLAERLALFPISERRTPHTIDPNRFARAISVDRHP